MIFVKPVRGCMNDGITVDDVIDTLGCWVAEESTWTDSLTHMVSCLFAADNSNH